MVVRGDGCFLIEIGLVEIKKIELNILLDIDEVCTLHKIPYYLAAGTLIGAVRHKGFIPWDDDIDIYIPRPYIRKFINVMRSNNKYNILSIYTEKKYFRAWIQVVDKQTILIEEGNDFPGYGLFVDVFPVDGLPTNSFFRKIYWKIIGGLKSLVEISRKPYKPAVKKIFKLPKILLFPIIHGLGPRFFLLILDVCAQFFDPYNCEYVGNLITAYDERETVKRNVIMNFTETEFEGHMFKIPLDYNQYLTNVYGEYMKLPPIEKRISRHSFHAYKK